jgi:hypothetical protein
MKNVVKRLFSFSAKKAQRYIKRLRIGVLKYIKSLRTLITGFIEPRIASN